MHLGVVVVNAKGEAVADQAALELLDCSNGELASRLEWFRVDRDGGGAGDWRKARIPGREGFRTVHFSSAPWGGEKGAYRIVVADGRDFDGLVTHIRQSSRWRAMLFLMPTLTHGMRAPLNGIVVNTELLKELSKSDAADDEQTVERRRRSLDALGRSVAGLRAVMENLTENLSEPAAEAVGRVDLRDVAQEVAALTRPRATVQRASMNVATGAEAAPVDGIRSQIKHALLNLVLNAIEVATPLDEINLAVGADGEERILSVASGAGGIASGVEGVRLGPEGDGVGVRLYVAREIAEAHGGELIVESDADGRNRVEIRLPAAAEGR